LATVPASLYLGGIEIPLSLTTVIQITGVSKWRLFSKILKKKINGSYTV